jgi:hypothetical protein
LVFLQSANDRETNLHFDWKARLPQEVQDRLSSEELELLRGPEASGPVVDILRAAGDEMAQQLEPSFENLGVDPRADRLRVDHPVHRSIRLVAETFGVDEFEVFQARRGLVLVEPSRPRAICVGQDVVKKYNAREQKFLIGRAVFSLLYKTAVLSGLSLEETANLLGAAVRVVVPNFTDLGNPSEDSVRTLRRTLSRRSLRALGPAARALAASLSLNVPGTLTALAGAANRAGLLMAADPAVALQLVLREDPTVSGMRSDLHEPVLHAVRERSDLRSLVVFALSEPFFRLRQEVGLALPEKGP